MTVIVDVILVSAWCISIMYLNQIDKKEKKLTSTKKTEEAGTMQKEEEGRQSAASPLSLLPSSSKQFHNKFRVLPSSSKQFHNKFRARRYRSALIPIEESCPSSPRESPVEQVSHSSRRENRTDRRQSTPRTRCDIPVQRTAQRTAHQAAFERDHPLSAINRFNTFDDAPQTPDSHAPRNYRHSSRSATAHNFGFDSHQRGGAPLPPIQGFTGNYQSITVRKYGHLLRRSSEDTSRLDFSLVTAENVMKSAREANDWFESNDWYAGCGSGVPVGGRFAVMGEIPVAEAVPEELECRPQIGR
eukprot:Selendium_serpulae@DN2355_c0_g1_i1.p1